MYIQYSKFNRLHSIYYIQYSTFNRLHSIYYYIYYLTKSYLLSYPKPRDAIASKKAHPRVPSQHKLEII